VRLFWCHAEVLSSILLLVRFVDELFVYRVPCRDLHALVVVGMGEKLLDLSVCWRHEKVLANEVLANQLKQGQVVLCFQAQMAVA
jgi:hypothetical protein